MWVQTLMPLTPSSVENSWSLCERLLLAEKDPDNSFLWWIEARKANSPNRNAMLALITEVFNQAWPERCSRFKSDVGRIVTDGEGHAVLAEPWQRGAMVYGPYMPLKPGRHFATFRVRVADVQENNVSIVRCDVLGAGGREIVVRHLTAQDIEASTGTIGLEFELPALEFGVQARCNSLGGATVRCVCWPALI